MHLLSYTSASPHPKQGPALRTTSRLPEVCSRNTADLIPRAISIIFSPLLPNPISLIVPSTSNALPLPSPNNLLRFISIHAIHKTLLVLLSLSISAPISLGPDTIRPDPRDVPQNDNLVVILIPPRMPVSVSISMPLFLSVFSDRGIDEAVVFRTAWVCSAGFATPALAGEETAVE